MVAGRFMMNAVLLVFALLSAPAISAQETPRIPVFHRLLVLNETNELMIVKIKNRELWVTPGWYQDTDLTIKQGLDQLAASYGLSVTPVLRGVFTLRMGQAQDLSTRLVYTATASRPHTKMPEIIEAIRWLPIHEASANITLPHIRAQIEQIIAHPDEVWGGSQRMQYKDGTTDYRLDENFYSF